MQDFLENFVVIVEYKRSKIRCFVSPKIQLNSGIELSIKDIMCPRTELS